MRRYVDRDQHEFDGLGAARWARDHNGRSLDVSGVIQWLGMDRPQKNPDL
jgi:hypothetical protein